jgi:hypothetical protein
MPAPIPQRTRDARFSLERSTSLALVSLGRLAWDPSLSSRLGRSQAPITTGLQAASGASNSQSPRRVRRDSRTQRDLPTQTLSIPG